MLFTWGLMLYARMVFVANDDEAIFAPELDPMGAISAACISPVMVAGGGIEVREHRHDNRVCRTGLIFEQLCRVGTLTSRNSNLLAFG